MLFTSDDYKKIQDWLLRNGKKIKDSEFPFVREINPLDELVILQNNVNKRTSLEFLADSVAGNVPVVSKKFIDDLIDGKVVIPDWEWSDSPDYPDYPYYPIDPEDPNQGKCGCKPISEEDLAEILK